MPVGTRSVRKESAEEHVMLSEDGKGVVAQD